MPFHGIAQLDPVISSITFTKHRNENRSNGGCHDNEKTRCSRPRVENEGGFLKEANLVPRQRSNALSFTMKVDSPYQDPGVIRRMQNFKFVEQDQRVCVSTLVYAFPAPPT